MLEVILFFANRTTKIFQQYNRECRNMWVRQHPCRENQLTFHQPKALLFLSLSKDVEYFQPCVSFSDFQHLQLLGFFFSMFVNLLCCIFLNIWVREMSHLYPSCKIFKQKQMLTPYQEQVLLPCFTLLYGLVTKIKCTHASHTFLLSICSRFQH